MSLIGIYVKREFTSKVINLQLYFLDFLSLLS